MEDYMRKWHVVFMLGLTLVFRVNGAPLVPCVFFFGDSLCDNGNNNQLRTIAKSNYSPFGIDFPLGPTGRFTNGKTIPDLITQFLGFDHYIPPYSEAKDEDLLVGVNYASASAGIREESGAELGERISFRKQVLNHQKVVSQVVNMIGDDKSAANHLGKCIYSVALGNNDYLNNYFLPTLYTTSREYNPEEFANDLIDRYTEQLTLLYVYGARKFVLNGVGVIACCPNILARFSPDGKTCVNFVDSASQIFNDKLKSLIDRLNNNFTDAKFIYGNNYSILKDLLNNPSEYGFKVVNEGCCGSGRNNGSVTCLRGNKPCPNRNEFVFWDAYHPTEATNTIIGQRLYRRRYSSDVYPIDVYTLAQL